MKHFNKILIAVMMVMGLNLTHKTVITHGQSLWSKCNRYKKVWVVEWLVRTIFLNPSVKDNWNVLPSVSYISVSRYRDILFGVQGSLNKIEI
jgi:hypothetical protein